MPKLRIDLQLKEKEIIGSVEAGEIKKEFKPKILKVARKAKVLSVRLNLEYRILFRRGRHSWLHYATIHRKELNSVEKKL